MKKNYFIIFIIATIQCNLLANESTTKTIGDILQIAIPATAYGTTLYIGDQVGEKEFYKSFGTNLAITYLLKYTINKQRPNGGNYSFPSGHTSASFQGAAFIHKRYGLNYAIPAYLGSIYVAYSRVHTKAHDVVDVIAGAVIGTASSFYFTTQYKGFKVQATSMGSGFGINISKNW